ncbi:hypothetical protein ACFVVX_36310 [Kitasatospora sp. NPDC058170]|uniref:hypothetical protein n=1 Tax=Kitasatospora sp. NPDC058170 TaxID=3346364 RepID=UPI0036DA0228
MQSENPRPLPPSASTVFWAGRCDQHARAVEYELTWWGHEFPDGPPDAEDALILLRRTIGETRSSGLGERTADLLEEATAPLDAARRHTARAISPVLLPLIAHHLRTAATALAATRTHLAANAPAGPYPPPPAVAPHPGR